MEKIFDQKFDDGTRLYCYIKNYNFVLGHCGIGEASDIFNEIKSDNDLIRGYILRNHLCPNDFCESGYATCQCCNFF